MDSLWIETFRYNKWANLHLLNVCRDFDDAQLQLTSPGTYGTVASTFLHLMSGEQFYLRRLGRGEPRITEESDFPGIAALIAHAERSGDELISCAERATPEDVVEVTGDDNNLYQLHTGVVLIQAIHHGNDHRTHICTILGSHGLDYGEMDVWAYGDATGAIAPAGAG